MPTYEYECPKCGHRLEAFQTIAERPLKKCPKCGEHQLKRLIGPGGGLLFKGSGFYITDYRPKEYKEKARAESGTKNEKVDSAKKPKDESKKKKEDGL